MEPNRKTFTGPPPRESPLALLARTSERSCPRPTLSSRRPPPLSDSSLPRPPYVPPFQAATALDANFPPSSSPGCPPAGHRLHPRWIGVPELRAGPRLLERRPLVQLQRRRDGRFQQRSRRHCFERPGLLLERPGRTRCVERTRCRIPLPGCRRPVPGCRLPGYPGTCPFLHLRSPLRLVLECFQLNLRLIHPIRWDLVICISWAGSTRVAPRTCSLSQPPVTRSLVFCVIITFCFFNARKTL